MTGGVGLGRQEPERFNSVCLAGPIFVDSDAIGLQPSKGQNLGKTAPAGGALFSSFEELLLGGGGNSGRAYRDSPHPPSQLYKPSLFS